MWVRRGCCQKSPTWAQHVKNARFKPNRASKSKWSTMEGPSSLGCHSIYSNDDAMLTSDAPLPKPPLFVRHVAQHIRNQSIRSNLTNTPAMSAHVRLSEPLASKTNCDR